MARKKLLRRVGIGLGGVVLMGAGLLFFTEPGKAVRDIWGTGAIQAAISEPEMRKYNATTETNLQAIYTALKLYHDSEGAFPQGKDWMDVIQNRLVTADMKGEEAAKKLVAPSLQGKPDQFGYALNDKAAGKYEKDIDPKAPLVFDSSDTSRNAHGDPADLLPKPPRDGQNMAIAVDGTLLKL